MGSTTMIVFDFNIALTPTALCIGGCISGCIGGFVCVYQYINNNSNSQIPQMNKSIAKTRNQLQRITYKINQLKTKYTGESYPNPCPHPDIENSQIEQSYKQQYSDQRNGQKQQIVLGSSSIGYGGINGSSVNLRTNGVYDDVYQKEFKVFRSEIYNYVDKCLMMAKERDQEAIERAVQAYLGSSRSVSKQNTERDGRLKKIEEQTTSCMAGFRQLNEQIKKTNQAVYEKINTNEQKLKKQLKQLKLQLQQRTSASNFNYEELMEEKIEVKIAEIQKQYSQQKDSRTKEGKNLGKLYEDLQKEVKAMSEVIKRIQQKENEQETSLSRINGLVKNIVNGDVKDLLGKAMATFEAKLATFAYYGQRIEILEEKIQQTGALVGSFKQAEARLSKKSQQMETKSRQAQKSLFQQLIHIKQELRESLPQPDSLTNQTQIKIEAAYLKPRLQQIKRQLSAKLSQEIEFNKQDILINVEEAIFQKVNKFMGQEKLRKSPKLQLDENKIVMKQQLKDVEIQLKNFVSEQFEKHLSMNLTKIDTIQTSFNVSNRQKTIPEQQNEAKKTQQIIQNKLNQFQADINETIKLLYEDIENRVNEMLGHSGLAEMKHEMENIKKQIKEMETKIKSLTLIATTNSPSPVQSISSPELFESLRNQVYNDMGCQIDKISSILERTVEEMEAKVEKLDHNFTYVYDRMSKIEFDNASFKDQLSKKVFTHGINIVDNKKAETQPKSKTDNHLLEALGQYNAGGYFFENS